mmetsp:Transcript_28833/g.72137  ORF Transcript_28833/g.72137 Transcript_28833/m.72137 type:complete len:265 (-) Transcript_28833:459-1253(-)
MRTSASTTTFFNTHPAPTSGTESPCRYANSGCPMTMVSFRSHRAPSTTQGPTMESTMVHPSPTTTPSLTMDPDEYVAPRKAAGGKHRGTVKIGYSGSMSDAAELAARPSPPPRDVRGAHNPMFAWYHSLRLRTGCQYPSCGCACTENPCPSAIGMMCLPKSIELPSSTHSITFTKSFIAFFEKMYTPMFTVTSQSSSLDSASGPTAMRFSSSNVGFSRNPYTAVSSSDTEQMPRLVASTSPRRRRQVAMVTSAPVSLCVLRRSL